MPISAGLVASAVASYAFVVLSARLLGPERYGPLAVLWSLVFTIGPGLFMPLEQEVSRAVTARRVAGLGARPVVRRAATFAALVVGGLALAALGARGFLVPRLFGGHDLLLVALVVSFLGYGVQHTARGVAAAERRFGAYGGVIGWEGALRILPVPLVAAAGAGSESSFGFVLAAAPLVAALVLLVQLRRKPVNLGDGPDLALGDLSRAVGFLVAGSVLGQLLINAPQLAVELLATEAERADTGRFFTALVLTRVPLFLFAAVQASQLPRLTRHVEGRDPVGFRRALRHLSAVVAGVGLLATAGAVVAGPTVLAVVFGEGFVLGRTHLAYLAGATACYLVALALSQGLVALSAHSSVPIGWAVGLGTFAALLAREAPVLLRVEQAMLGGCAAAAVVMGLLVALRLRTGIGRAGPVPPAPPVAP